MKKIIAFVGLAIALNSTSASAMCVWATEWNPSFATTLMFTDSCTDVKKGAHNNRTKAYTDALFTWVLLNTDTEKSSSGGVSWHTNAVWGIPGFHLCEIRAYYEKSDGGYRSAGKTRNFCL